MPESRFRSVDLPDPDGPINATNSPLAIVSETRSSACTSSAPRRYHLDTPRIVIGVWATPSRGALRAGSAGFEEARHSHAAADAHRHQAITLLATAQLAQDVCHHARAGHAAGMPARDR